MADSPSHEWSGEGDPRHLVKRAVDTREVGDPEEAEAKATKPYKLPEPVKRRITGKAVRADGAEDKSVKAAAKK